MKQVLNIYLKDVRHYWRECIISMALVAVLGWNEMHGWLHQEEMGATTGIGGLFSLRLLSGLMVVLVPVTWSLVVVRVIQGESLVGDRQFWVTRPYEWKKLLAAKALFALTFVNLPLLVLDVFLLAEAGFRPINYIAGLFWMQLMIALYFVLPLAALATVTATVVQMLLALLLLVLYGIGMGQLSGQIPDSSFSGPVDSLTAALWFGVCLAVIWMQYARRRTNNSRALIAGLAGVFLLILVATPYRSLHRSLVAREFPQLSSGQQAPFQLALLPAEKVESESASEDEDQKEIGISLPLGVSGLEPESIATVDGARFALEAPDGLQWDSGWEDPGLSLFPDQRTTRVNFTLKRRVFERIRSAPVEFRLSIAFTLFHDTHRREFVTPPGVFGMEDVGLCSAETNYIRTIRCLAPLRRPTSLLISADTSMSTCPVLEGEAPAAHGGLARDWMRGGSSPAEFGISPVKTVDLYLVSWNDATNRRNPGVCPGTPLVLSSPEPVRRNQTTLQIDGLRLADYRLPSPKVVRFATHQARP
jgi:hypothetical protein